MTPENDVRLRAAERALCDPDGRQGPLTEWDLDRGWERLQPRLAREGSIAAKPRPPRAAWLVAATAAAGIALFALPRLASDFEPRGAPPPELRCGIRALAVGDGGRVREERASPLRVGPGERLLVTASNPGEEAMWLTLLARAGQGRAQLVGAPEQVAPRTVDEPMNGDRMPALRAHVRAGRVALEAVFTPSEPDAATRDRFAAWPPALPDGAVSDAVDLDLGGAP